MSDHRPHLYLVTPVISDPDAFASALADLCRSNAEIAALLLRLAPADERSLVNAIKTLAPIAQEAGAAVLASVPGDRDLPAITLRGGGDGVHASAPADWAALRGRLRDPRILGAGGLRTRDDAMRAGEAGVDYVMMGEPRPDGYVPPFDDVLDQAEWWAEIFETPCVAFAPTLDAVGPLAATGVEFVALGDAVWNHPKGTREALEMAERSLARRAGTPA